MVDWIIFEASHKPIIDEIGKQSDRGAALIASSYLEDVLESSLKSLIWSDTKTNKEVFAGTGPFATFSAKINVCYMLGLYPQEIQKICHTVRKIRNEFAHEIQPISFSTQQISNLCGNLSVPVFSSPDGSAAPQVIVDFRDQISAAKDNRERFMASIIMVTALLATTTMLSNLPGTTKSPPFSSLYKF